MYNKKLFLETVKNLNGTPEMKKGGTKGFSSNLGATNRLFKKNSLFKKNPLSKPNPLYKKKNYKSKTYDPQSMYFDNGGINKLEGNLISKVLMERNRGVDFVDRAFALGDNPGTPMFNLPDDEQFGQNMSHKMAWGEDDNGQAWMYPTIMNPNNEAIQVPNQYADYISSEGYKNATGMNQYKAGGALLTKKVTCKKCGWKWDAADGGDDVTTCHKCGGQGLVHAQKGGTPNYINTELTPKEIEYYRKGGYIVEEVSDPSIPRLNTMQRGGPFAENPDIPVPPEELCEEGYAWDQEKNICIPLPDMKEWFTNWYANRTLPLDEIKNKKYVALMKEKLPQYNPESTLLQRISELPDPTYVDIVDKNPKNMGQIIYDKDWNASGLEVKQSLKGNAKELGRTLAHENSTLIDDPDSEVQFPAQNLVIDPGLVLFKDRWGDLKGKEKADAEDYYNYQTDPATDNIHSMIFEERFARGLKPDQVITAEDIEKWKKEAEESGELNQDSENYNNALYSLLKLSKDSNALAKWFNELASNDTPVDENAPQYAKHGGSMGYNLGDQVDESTMRKLKRLGYKFEKVK